MTPGKTTKYQQYETVHVGILFAIFALFLQKFSARVQIAFTSSVFLQSNHSFLGKREKRVN